MVHKLFKDGVYQAPEEYKEDIEELRQWLTEQHHLPTLTDEHLNLFLHSCEGNLMRTKVTMENYFTLRTHTPELFANRNPLSNDIQEINLVPLAHSSREGYKVLVYRLTNYEPSKLNFTAGIKMFLMYNDMRLAEDGLEPGYIVVFDMKGITLGHLSRINLSIIKKFIVYIQDCHPARLKGIHVINTVSFIDKVMTIIKPFLKGSIMQIIHFHGGVQSLEKYMSLEILPQEYGGQGDSFNVYHAQQRKLLEEEYVTWFREEENYKVDESKRKGKKNTQADTYGARGSFRKLAID
ncbi:hypothetical protein L9F63_008579 [Diploptera punctata]|uniref:CRAL-TRIO domain-containing protein n=1 Tax=Diploptera punctata TaxID=6984 RepID=A0AAD7Z512_DIPPU|nr:hypothetical protein L9F63_008579 [Diploptera punctata]